MILESQSFPMEPKIQFSDSNARGNGSQIIRKQLSCQDVFKHSQTIQIKLLKQLSNRSSRKKGVPSMEERNITSGDDCELFGESLKLRVALCNQKLIFNDSQDCVNCSQITCMQLSHPYIFKHSQTRAIKFVLQLSSRSRRNRKVNPCCV